MSAVFRPQVTSYGTWGWAQVEGALEALRRRCTGRLTARLAAGVVDTVSRARKGTELTAVFRKNAEIQEELMLYGEEDLSGQQVGIYIYRNEVEKSEAVAFRSSVAEASLGANPG